LHVSAFYILPIPAIHLSDYLDNIFQISIVIFAALISYKVFSYEDSEAKKFFKNFNKTLASRNTTPKQKQGKLTHSTLTKEARLCVKLAWDDNIKVNEDDMNQKYITCELMESALILKLMGDSDKRKCVKLLAENIKLDLGSIPLNSKQVSIPLSKANLTFKLLSPFRREKVTVSLAEASIGKDLMPASEYVLYISSNDRKTTVSLTTSTLSCVSKYTKIDHLEVPLKCYATKTVSGNQGGVYCQLDHVISLSDEMSQKLITAWINETIEALKVPYSQVAIRASHCENGNNIHNFEIVGDTEIFKGKYNKNSKIRMTRQFIELRYTIEIQAGGVFTIECQNTHLIVKYENQVILSVPAAAKFTTVKLMARTTETTKIRYDHQIHDIKIGSNPASIKLVRDSQGQYKCVIHGKTEGYPYLSVTCGIETQITCVQEFSEDTTFEFEQNHLKVQYKDEDWVTLNVPYESDETHKLHLIPIKRECYSSYLYLPYSETLQSRDVFEEAGEAFGQVALSMPK